MANEIFLWGRVFDSTIAQTKLAGSWIKAKYFFTHGLAIDEGGTLWSTGGNSFGELGIGSLVSTYFPTWNQVGTAKWKDIAGGNHTSIGIQEDGSLWYWGKDLVTSAAVQSPTLLDAGVWDAVYCSDSGTEHALAINSAGALYSWGYNGEGELGVGDYTSRATPTLVHSGPWAHAACHSGGSIAVKQDGTLWVFGQTWIGSSGALSNVPVQVGIATNWATVAAGLTSFLATKTDKTLWSWGYTSSGSNWGILGLGDSTLYTYTPMQVSGASWEKVYATYGHALGVQSDGTLWAWGTDTYNTLGIAAVGLQVFDPTPIDDYEGWADAWAGRGVSVAFKLIMPFWTNSRGQREVL